MHRYAASGYWRIGKHYLSSKEDVLMPVAERPRRRRLPPEGTDRRESSRRDRGNRGGRRDRGRALRRGCCVASALPSRNSRESVSVRPSGCWRNAVSALCDRAGLKSPRGATAARAQTDVSESRCAPVRCAALPPRSRIPPGSWYRAAAPRSARRGAAYGIHGQGIFIYPDAEMVVIRFASHPIAANATYDATTLPEFDALAKHLMAVAR